jgi:hypothetical protein
MNFQVTLPLHASAQQTTRLVELQCLFAQACNVLSVLARDHRCWNRVALHHLGYRRVREVFPALGSQMACNAVYSVSRSCRWVYQDPGSPFNMARMGERPLPLLRFADSCPVYFDRHTVSVKAQRLSMFTLDGRLKFDTALGVDEQDAFHSKKLREIVLSRNVDNGFMLQFLLSDFEGAMDGQQLVAVQQPAQGVVPSYLKVEEVV